METAYELFRNGTRLLEDGDFHAAAVPLARARDLEPDKTSIREALGRALFGSRRYREAAEEFGKVV
ncbi:MAG: protein-glutamine gamma-glutamyltransferase, partial [Solirubrobacteraceae bacterium]|nr:protein-glutamine gamma-glutamyltransferase [Solirubrobacteraceae bacterium]